MFNVDEVTGCNVRAVYVRHSQQSTVCCKLTKCQWLLVLGSTMTVRPTLQVRCKTLKLYSIRISFERFNIERQFGIISSVV